MSGLKSIKLCVKGNKTSRTAPDLKRSELTASARVGAGGAEGSKVTRVTTRVTWQM